ncbi:hypothetical protein KJ865_16565, partial [Myxococcota bacterium]|nr:hypothetical protein [Myxococcota bacterium]
MKRKNILFNLVLALVGSLVFTACPGGTTPPPVRTLVYPANKIMQTNTVTVEFLTYNPSTGGGNLHPARIQVGPNTDREPNVGISGDMSGGLGEQWQAAVWIASLQASFAVGRDLTDYAVLVRGKGYIDGPSAGALFTAGIMAAMMGIPSRTDVTMTGTVNPDGTVGPVGGIPNKFKAALAAGKKVLGYPIGQRFAMDYQTKQLVDLQALAMQRGARAVEISSIYDAFQLLTGKPFPRPAIVSETEMALDQTMTFLLRKKAAKWNDIYTKYKNKFPAARLDTVPGAVQRFSVGNQFMTKAVEFLREGSIASAYDFAQRGASHSFTSYWYGFFHKFLYITKGKYALLGTVLKKLLLDPVFADIDKGLKFLRKAQPVTVSDLMALIASYEQMVAALSYAVDAQQTSQTAQRIIQNAIALVKKKVPVNAILSAIYSSLKASSYRVGLATVKVEKASDFISFKSTRSNRMIIEPTRLRQVNKIFLGAAQANLKYMDSVLTRSVAKSANKTVESVQKTFMSKYNNYLQAFYSLKIPENYFRKQWGENDPGTLYSQIAGAMGSYFNSSMFLMKYYSLSIRRSRVTGNIEAVKMQKALVNMLKHAEYNSRMYAALAKNAVGEI